MVPVWRSTCVGDTTGFSTCVLPQDEQPAGWGPSMGSHLLAQGSVDTAGGAVSLDVGVTPTQRTELASDGLVLVSFVDSDGAVNAWSFPVVEGTDPTPTVTVTADPTATPTVTITSDPTSTPTVTVTSGPTSTRRSRSLPRLPRAGTSTRRRASTTSTAGSG